MATRKKRAKGAGITQVIVAGSAGTIYSLGFEAAAKKIPTINNNYFAFKAGIAGVVGAALAYLSKNQNVQAAGLGLAGLAGSVAGNAIANKMPMNGTNRVPLNGLKEAVRRRRLSGASTNSAMPVNGSTSFPMMDSSLYLS